MARTDKPIAERDKQAVVLIHGIGEQKPMETLRRFVHAVWSSDSEIKHRHARPSVWSKPDSVSDNFELRRLTTSKNRKDVKTDFFEFYWAHLMKGTKLAHVLAWARILLVRWPWRVPRRLFGVWLILVLASISVILLVVNGSIPEADQWVTIPAWASGLAGLLVAWLTGFVVIGVIGDAARYLHPAPANIQQRHAIRMAGVRLLRTLHGSRKYRRIVLVGHSLGSVIGYDILTHAWPDYNGRLEDPQLPEDKAAATELEAMALGKACAQESQPAQSHYLKELQSQGNGWLVSDFVTLGSPLAHAAVLLARSSEDLRRKQEDREFPTCLPQLENGHFTFVRSFVVKSGRTRQFRIPHHAAVFGPTRWTNLYFPARFVIWGDIIGGPLAPVFGRGIRDLRVKTTRRLGLFSHTLYWSLKDGQAPPSHVCVLREAVNLIGFDSNDVDPDDRSSDP